MNNIPGLEMRLYHAREADLIARAVTRRAQRPVRFKRLRAHLSCYRREYLELAAIVVIWIAYCFTLPPT